MQTLGVVNSIAYICGLEQYDQSTIKKALLLLMMTYLLGLEQKYWVQLK